MIAAHRFTRMDADYYQFHLKDAAANGHLGDAWTEEALARNLAVAPFVVGVGTSRNSTVWVDVEVHERAPERTGDDRWAQVLECSLELPSGLLLVTSPTLEAELRGRVEVVPGWYRLRIHYGRNRARGAHRYKVQLWMAPPSDVAALGSGA